MHMFCVYTSANYLLPYLLFSLIYLVDELAREMLSSLGQDSTQDIGGGASGDIAPTTRKGLSYNDLVQEGMISLLRAMSTYDNYKQHNNATFQEYAKQSISSSFLQYMAQSSQIRLPLSIQTTLQSANVAATKLRQRLGKEPTLTQVANEVQIDPEKLLLYRKLYKSKHGRDAYVSVEDGLEIYDPTLGGLSSRIDTEGDNKVDSSTSSTESSSTVSTASTTSVDILSDNEQELLAQINFQEDDWTNDPPERSVSPLKDVLTDTEELNNPLSYTHHYLVNEELNEFLKETLTDEELIIIQLRFGLVDSKYGGKGWSAKDIGRRLNMDHDEVLKIASVALEKLRMNREEMENEYDNDAYVEVSL